MRFSNVRAARSPDTSWLAYTISRLDDDGDPTTARSCWARRSSATSTVRRAALIVLAARLSACTGTSGEPGVETRDSLGITIVENGPVLTLPEAFVISPEPDLDLGGQRADVEQELDPSSPFHNAARTSDGRYVVISNGALKMFDSDGEYIRTIGRPGVGPGEFRQIGMVCVTDGDTILALHYSRPSVSVFDARGEHVRTFNVQARYVGGAGCFEDGSVVIHDSARPNPDSELTPEQASVLDRVMTLRRVAMDGSEMGPLGEYPGGSTNMFFQTIANAVPHGGSIYVGDGTIPEFHVHDLEGTLTRIVRWSAPLVPVTPEMIDERIRGSIPRTAPPEMVQQRLDFGHAQPQPSTVPVYFRIMVDESDRVWVQDNPIGSTIPWPWTVFAADGRALGRVYLPQVPGASQYTVEIRSIGEDVVLLHWRDEEFGFPHLTYHALGPAPEG